VSCQAISRARSDAASALPIPEDTIAYGFMFRPFLSCVAQGDAAFDVIPEQTDECRPYERTAGRAVSVR
jgi:hypothetical protein